MRATFCNFPGSRRILIHMLYVYKSTATVCDIYCGVAPKSHIIERPLLVKGHASRSGFIGNSSFPTQRENSCQSYNSLYKTINALNRQRTYNISQLSKTEQLNEVFSIYDLTVQYIREHQSQDSQLSKSETQ
jgi:hypothetical protein